MHIPPESALSLLHLSKLGTLATHSHQLPGYPFATAIPYALDAAHNPVLCISALAEHTKNVLTDPRVSLSVVQPGAEDVHDTARLTLVADAERIEPDEALRARYLRYLPRTEDLLMLDFMFFRLRPKRICYIGGVGRMGWAIVWGMKWARTIALVHIGLTIALLLLVRSQFLRDPLSYWYIGIAVLGPLLVSAGFTYQAHQRSEFVRAGTLMKVAMVAAICYAILIRFIP